jgi:hypothetical protein
MDPLHERLARLALSAAAPFGFALAGGYAVQVHGFLSRPSADVDIVASSRAECDFPAGMPTHAYFRRHRCSVDPQSSRSVDI